MKPIKQIVILGATGSVGQSTLSVLELHPQAYKVIGLSAHTRMAELAALVVKYQPAYVTVPTEIAAIEFKRALGSHPVPTVLLGAQGLCELAALQAATHIVAAIVGAAGLPSCMAAAKAGKTILLANKEALVMAGSFFLQAVKGGGATLLPLDSEHNALFQCLPQGQGSVDATVRSVWLTASGGPFLKRAPDTLRSVTPDEACKHPKWSMGRKISVDSATLMNKGLEVIEAALMYGLPANQVKVVIHPQSTIHALVQYVDGSLLAHLSHPDMCVPIAQALAYPQRMESGVADLDMTVLEALSFAPPDTEHFPCLALAYQALAMGQHGCIALNAANEVAVEAFLNHGLAFTDIAVIVREVLNQAIDWPTPNELAAVYALDARARELANVALQRSAKP
jgi:1-deoxy-D-xylulose-5-phosphate reductoisomerase